MRVKRTTSDWAAILLQYKAAGQSVGEFCRDKGINPNLFYRKRKALSDKEHRFIKLPDFPADGSQAAQIHIGDISITVSESTSTDLLARLIRCALEVVHVRIS